MANFKQSNRPQGLFLTVNLEDQLLIGTFEWTIDYLIGELDLSLFEQNYHNDETGAKAYPPSVLLKLIFYCYSKGIVGSREIERASMENITAKALAENHEPDHSTIAAFISKNFEAVNDLYTQVLMQCEKLKLITGEMFAIDGCKLPSCTSKEWSGTIADLTKKRDKLQKYIARLLRRHKELDKDEKAEKKLKPFTKTMGDSEDRRDRTIKRLKSNLKKLNKFLEDAEPREGLSGEEVQSNITDNESALIKGPHGYIQGYNGIAVADSGNQIIIAAEAVGSGPESGSFPEMLDALEENMKAVTGKKEPLKDSLVEGDCGFFTERNLQEAAKRGIKVLIPDPQFRQRDPHFAEKKDEKVKKKKRFTVDDFTYNKKKDSFLCPAGKELDYKCDTALRNNTGRRYKAKIGDCRNCPLADKCIADRGKKNTSRTLYIPYMKYDKNLSEEMREKIDDPVNRELYSRRMQIIEPVFSDITYCKGMDRFTFKGKKKVNIQWLLFCMVHNLWKCIKPLTIKRQKQ